MKPDSIPTGADYGGAHPGGAESKSGAWKPRPAGVAGPRQMEGVRVRPHLTERAKVTLRLVCDGLTNPEIAESLNVSRETVKSELKRLFRKIGVSNRTQAAVLLIKQGWLQ